MGFSVLSVGSPSAEKDGFSLFLQTLLTDWQLGRHTNIEIQREAKSERAIDRQMPATHTEKQAALFFYTCADWQAWQLRWRRGQTESRHMRIIYTAKYTFIQLQYTLQKNPKNTAHSHSGRACVCMSAFLLCFSSVFSQELPPQVKF